MSIYREWSCKDTLPLITELLPSLQTALIQVKESTHLLQTRLGHLKFVKDEAAWVSSEIKRLSSVKHAMERECNSMLDELHSEAKRLKHLQKRREAVDQKVEEVVERLKSCVGDL